MEIHLQRFQHIVRKSVSLANFSAGRVLCQGQKVLFRKTFHSEKVTKSQKNSKLFPVDVFLDEVVSSLSLSLSLPLPHVLSAIANQAQVLLSKIKASSRETVTN